MGQGLKCLLLADPQYVRNTSILGLTSSFTLFMCHFQIISKKSIGYVSMLIQTTAASNAGFVTKHDQVWTGLSNRYRL